MIDIRNVTKLYGPKVAVQELSLHVPAGELFAFLGPNGAGKTTTIKMLCGLLFPTTGSVSVGGFDVRAEGDHARALVSYVPDQPFLYEKLTGREFLQFTADLYAMPAAKSAEKIEEVIELFHLEEFVDDLTERYSHGMRQRTVFAAALVHDPKLLIADEPTVGLDPKSIRELKTLLRKLAGEGMTIFLSTHTLDIAQELADRIGILDRGRLLGCGNMTDLRKQANQDGSLEDLFMKITEEVSAEAATAVPMPFSKRPGGSLRRRAMPIPARLRPLTPTAEEFQEYMELSRQIEHGLELREDVTELLARWNARAGRGYQPSDFHYHGAIDRDTFVAEMLLGEPAMVPDLTYDELREVLRSAVGNELSEAIASYFLNWLEANLPGANVSDLLYWPNQWFNDDSLLQVELTPDQILAYAMAKSGRHVPGAPTGVPMPYPIP